MAPPPPPPRPPPPPQMDPHPPVSVPVPVPEELFELFHCSSCRQSFSSAPKLLAHIRRDVCSSTNPGDLCGCEERHNHWPVHRIYDTMEQAMGPLWIDQYDLYFKANTFRYEVKEYRCRLFRNCCAKLTVERHFECMCPSASLERGSKCLNWNTKFSIKGCLIHSHQFGGYQPFLVFDEGKRIAVDCIQDGLSNTEIMEEISRVPESKKFDVASLDLMIAKLRPAYGVIPYRGKEYRNMRQVRNLSTAQSARPPDKRYARGPGYDRSRSPSDRSSRGPPAPSSLAARGLHNSRSRSPFNPRDRDLRSSSYRSNEEDFGGRRGHDGFDYYRAEKTASVAGDDALWHSLKGAVGNAVDTDYFLSQWNSVISSDSAEGTRPADDRLGPDSSDARAGPSGHRMNSDSRARDRTSVSSVGSARDPSGGIRDPLSSSRTAGRAPSASSPLVSQCKNKLAALQRYLGSGACDTLDDQDFVLKLGDLLKKIKDIPP